MKKTAKEFPEISYSLEQNFLPDKKLVRLEHRSLILSASYCLKKLDILKALEEIDFKIDDILSDEKIIGLIDDWVTSIVREVSKHINEKFKLLELSIAKPIHLVVVEAIRFFQIAKIYLLKEKTLFIKNLVVTSQGTVNSRNTAIKVIENEDLTCDRKFVLSAQFFLKDYVKKYYSQLTNKQKEYFKVDIDENFAFYYWVWKIESCRKRIKNYFAYHWSENWEKMICTMEIVKDDFTIQNIFRRAVKHHNECAIHYLWKTHVSKYRERQLIMEEIICSYYEKATHTNIILYLIFDSGIYEMIDTYLTKGFRIQMLFYNNKRWIDLYFKVLETIQPYFADYHYSIILNNIAKSFENKDLDEVDLGFLKKFYTKIPIARRNMLLDNEDSWKDYYELLRVAFEDGDYRLVILILKTCEQFKIFTFFYSYYGIKLFEILIAKNNYDFSDWLLNTYLRRDQSRAVKKNFFRFRAFDICFNYIIFGTKMLETFLNWFKDSVNKILIEDFKSELPYKSNGKIVEKLLFSFRAHPCYKPFFFTNKILVWCVGEENVQMVKSSISLLLKEDEESQEHSIKYYERVIELVLESNWNLLNELMSWIGYTSDDKKTLGRKLLLDSYLLEEILKKTDVLDFLYGFSNWLIKSLSFKPNNEVIKKFKGKVFEKLPVILSSLIMEWDLDGIKKAISWCNQPVRESRFLYKKLFSKLEMHKPNTMNSQRELNELVKLFK